MRSSHQVSAFRTGTLDYPGGPVVETLHFHFRGCGFISGGGTKIPHATQRGQKKKKKNRDLVSFVSPQTPSLDSEPAV